MAKRIAKKSGSAKSKNTAMPKREKPSDELIKKFYAALPDDKKVERKKLFGFPCAFVNGNMAFGLHNKNIIARLDEEQRNDWIKNKNAKLFEPMPGRPMKEYITLPKNVVDDPSSLSQILQLSFKYVLTLKPKEKKK
jgi:TfoX/Sxy family transcriptional regulator of competence genes